MNGKLRTLLTAAGSAALLAACAVGPKAPLPTIPAEGQGAFIGSQSASVSTEAARDDWWRLYQDPTLDGLIQQALTENNELEAAAANLRAVRASLSEARSGRFPTTTTSAAYNRSRASTDTVPTANGAKLPEVDTYDVGLDVAYEIDLFGRVESSIRAARGDVVAAAAALDIALWDLRARAADQPLWSLLGERRHERIAGYVSGLPAATLEEKVAMARTFQQQGHTAFKVHAVVSHDGIAEEMAALRQALGADAQLMVDLHWKFDLEGALQLAHQLQPVGLTFIEAPLKPEDVPGLVALGQQSPIPVAAGEEWPTDYVARPRVEGESLAYVQPEMGHTGITQFLRIARLAAAHGVQVAPHATIGGGIFMAASLHASAVVEGLWRHEWQHSIFSRSVQMLDTDMAYTQDGYQLPSGPGLGAVPNTTFWQHAEAVA